MFDGVRWAFAMQVHRIIAWANSIWEVAWLRLRLRHISIDIGSSAPGQGKLEASSAHTPQYRDNTRTNHPQELSSGCS